MVAPVRGAELRRNRITNPRQVVGQSTAEAISRYGWALSSVDVTGHPLGITTARRLTCPSDQGLGGRGFDWYGNQQLATPSTSGTWLAQPVTPGEQIQVRAWARHNTSASQLSLGIRFHNGAGAWVSNNISKNTDVPTNKWTECISDILTAPAGATHVVGYLWFANGTGLTGQWIDETGLYFGKPGTYFDGSMAPTLDREYAWVGAANASASIEYERIAAIVAAADPDGRPWVGVTLRGFQPGDQVYTLWRTADGERMPVRGATRRPVSDSDYVIDYEPPLARPVQYDLEVLSGPDAGSLTAPAVTRVDSETGFIHDPLDPTNFLPVHGDYTRTGEPMLRGSAFSQLVYEAESSLMPIIGSSKAVDIAGQRQAAAGVDLSMLTKAEEENTRLRNLLKQAPILVVRGLPGWLRDAWPGVAYVSAPRAVEEPLDVSWGGYQTRWQLEGRIVAAPTARILIALFTYDDVAALFATYDQKQTAMAGKTYLDDLKDPLGANQTQRASLMSTT